MKNLFIFLLFIWAKTSFGQKILEQYIQEGFERNQSIQQQRIVLERNVYALREAQTLFFPKITLMADYFLAGGGRTVDFPAGTLLNPVYGSLNQLTGSNSFPQLENESILLNPNNFYDAKLRTSMPLLNAEIKYNKKIKQEQISLQEIEINLFKRELAKEIKVAYFKYLQSVEAIRIYEEALQLVNESKRINEALFKNEKVNRTVVLRAETEVVRYQSLLENAREISQLAKSYFNFLLNKNLTDSILIDTSYRNTPSLGANQNDIEQREEIQKIRTAGKINEHLEGLSKAYKQPKLNTFLDVGSQGFDWQVNNKTRYYFFGLSLQWDLFSFQKNKHKTKQAALELKATQTSLSYVEHQLKLQQLTSFYNFNTSLNTYRSAVFTQNTAQRFYADMLKLYKSGQALFIELLDAQNQLVQAELQVKISLYDTYIKEAELERANASFNIK